MPRPRGKESVALRHAAVELDIRDVLFDRLISGGRWTLDPFGYNFRHEMEFSADDAAAMPDGRFEVRYALTATTGEVTNLRFQLKAT